MKEYIEREALQKAINTEISEHVEDAKESLYERGYNNGLMMAYALLLKAPAADVVEVVRCGQCKYWQCYGGEYADDGECWHLGELNCCMHKDDYCSKGKRKMDKEE